MAKRKESVSKTEDSVKEERYPRRSTRSPVKKESPLKSPKAKSTKTPTKRKSPQAKSTTKSPKSTPAKRKKLKRESESSDEESATDGVKEEEETMGSPFSKTYGTPRKPFTFSPSVKTPPKTEEPLESSEDEELPFFGFETEKAKEKRSPKPRTPKGKGKTKGKEDEQDKKKKKQKKEEEEVQTPDVESLRGKKFYDEIDQMDFGSLYE